jgi:CRISPR/Cas system CSM-associated protein Csm3 (group 7 of RAMP superfamily)
LQWRDYAGADHLDPLRDIEAFKTPAEAAREAWEGLQMTAPLDNRQRLRLEFDLQVDGTLLIRSPGQAADDPDFIRLTERGSSVLSGTSLAGSLRSHAGRILKTLWKNEASADEHLSSLFGCSESPQGDGSDGNDAARHTDARIPRHLASRVIVSETDVKRSRQFIQNRVKIDRLTGGAQDTALFDEQPCVGGRVQFVVEALRHPETDPSDAHFNADIGLLLLLARDLSNGLVSIGGGSAVGRGILKGGVKVKLPGKDQAVVLQDGGEALQMYVDTLAGFEENAR